jgi:hypothetical protein
MPAPPFFSCALHSHRKGIIAMSRSLTQMVLISFAISSFCAVVAGCNYGPRRLTPPKMSPSNAASQALKMYDANSDGKISGDEFNACLGLKAIAKDGAVTGEMISSLVEKWQKGAAGRVGAGVTVLRNGKSLGGASVKFVPEKFLGGNVQPATGTTDANGTCAVTVPVTAAGEPKGLFLGFYRVEVTKSGENIPEKYNTETSLSCAVLNDANNVSFNLVY